MQKEILSKIIVILGPTASGKSDLAIRIAKKFNGEIISADSRQIYRGMDIGTGKVTQTEQKLVKHWMIDILDPKTNFSAAQFKKKAEIIIENILKRGKVPIICGGTGFWIKSLVDNISYPEVKPDRELRSKLRNKPAEELFTILEKLDAERAKNIDSKNKVRLIRAIEIVKKLGSVPKLKTSSQKLEDSKYDFLQIGINIPKKKLNKNIKKRLDLRFKRPVSPKVRRGRGMIEEVQRLNKNGVSWERLEYFGLEYRWIARYLQKKISLREMEEKLYFDIIHYAKRQMTWFKKDKRILWLKNYAEAELAIKKFLL